MHLVQSKSTTPETPESLFMAKYEWMLKWALYFSEGDPSIAEDMVQDAFVRFVLAKPDLSLVENEEALLYTYLKYVHLSRVRRVQRQPLQQLSMVDFDSIELGLRQHPPEYSIEAQDQLRRIVAYLSWRKESAKSASLLVLRFLHGYFPGDIMLVAKTSRPGVDNGLKSARDDVKAYLTAPRNVSFPGAGSPPEIAARRVAVPFEDLHKELKTILFTSCVGPCAREGDLVGLYSVNRPETISRELLAHLVSCSRCLDIVNRKRKIPPLSERSSEDFFKTSRRNSTSKRSSDAIEVEKRRAFRLVERRLRDVLEHRPRRLMIAVNGHMIAAQEVNSEFSKQEVEVGLDTRVEIIDVLSEQGLCLLSLVVTALPPAGPPEERQVVELSCGRRIEAVLRFTSSGSMVEVAYRDPSYSSTAVASRAFDMQDRPVRSAESSKRIPHDQEWSEDGVDASQRPGKSRLTGCLVRWLHFLTAKMDPTRATAIVLAAASAVCFSVWLTQPPNISANAFLNRAMAQDAVSSEAVGLVRQTVRVTTLHRTSERTLHLDLRRTRHPRIPKLNAEDGKLRDALAAGEVSWDAPLSAGSYLSWRDHQRVRNDQISRTGNHLLRLTTTVSDGPVASASITVRDSDFHPVERSVEYRNKETIEIAELSYDVLPWSGDAEQWFDPPYAPGSALRNPEMSLSSLPKSRGLSEGQLDEAELGAQVVLNELHADVAERIEMRRSSSGIRVIGIVETAGKKHSLEAALRQVPNVTPSISTFSESSLHQGPHSSRTIVTVSSSLTYPSPLETLLIGRGQNSEEAANLSQRLLDSAMAAEQHGTQLASLSRRYSSDPAMTERARDAFERLVDGHVLSLLAALEDEETYLAAAAIPIADLSEDANDDLQSLENQNVRLCLELTSGSQVAGRPAEIILPEMAAAATSLRRATLALRARSNHAAPLTSPPTKPSNN